MGVVFNGGRFGVVLFISDASKAGAEGGWGLAKVERWGGPRPRTTER